MSVGRRRRGIDGIRIHVVMPEHLILRFDTLYTNRARGKLIFGIRSQVLTDLLEKHVSELEAQMAARATDPYSNPEFLT